MGPAPAIDAPLCSPLVGNAGTYSPVPKDPPVSPDEVSGAQWVHEEGIARAASSSGADTARPETRRLLCRCSGKGLAAAGAALLLCAAVAVGLTAAGPQPERSSGGAPSSGLWSTPWFDAVSQGACEAAEIALGRPLCVTSTTTSTTITVTSTTSTTVTTTTLTRTHTSTTSTTFTRTTSTSTTSTTTTTLPPLWPRPEKDPSRKHVIKGISYAPVPIRDPGMHLPHDDFMSPDSAALWSRSGRNDLGIVKALGANTIRMYGNNPALDHAPFLDEAHEQGLDVIAGISDWPYTQMSGNCLTTDLDCYEQVKDAYAQNLERGFLREDGSYHTALRTVILMNEPDLKFVGSNNLGFKKALVSAFDAVLSAEKEAGLEGVAPNFTVTFSFGVCPQCEKFGYKPGIGQMLELREAMRDPRSVGYTPRNDLWTNYKFRFVNSVNTANPNTDIRRLFLDDYDVLFQGTPVFIGEYHDPDVYERQDLQGILAIAEDESTLLSGIAFFEFQVRYDKGGSEMGFGMLGLSETHKVKEFSMEYKPFTSWCLTPVKAERRRPPPGMSLFLEASQDVFVHAAVAEAFGGKGLSESQLCPEAPAAGKLEQAAEGPASSGAGKSSKSLVPVTWIGCFALGKKQGRLFVGSGQDSDSCAESCESFGLALLKGGGECYCSDLKPAAPFFRQVGHEDCGDVCAGEGSLTPTRYCGGSSAFAAYSVYSAKTPAAEASTTTTSDKVPTVGEEGAEARSLKDMLADNPEMELGPAAPAAPRRRAGGLGISGIGAPLQAQATTAWS